MMMMIFAMLEMEHRAFYRLGENPTTKPNPQLIIILMGHVQRRDKIAWTKNNLLSYSSTALLPPKMPFHTRGVSHSSVSFLFSSPPHLHNAVWVAPQLRTSCQLSSCASLERASALDPRPLVQGFVEENKSHLSPGPMASSSPAQH